MDALGTRMRWKEMENTIKTYEDIINTQKKMIDMLLEYQNVIVMPKDGDINIAVNVKESEFCE